MKRRSVQGLVLVAATACGVLAGCAAPSADPDTVAAEVKGAIRTQVEAYAARDLEKMTSVMAPDYVWIMHGQPNLSGDAAVRAAIDAQFADPALALTVADEAVDVSETGDMAVYRATYRYTFTDPATKSPVVERGNWVAVFRRQNDGTMKLARDVIVDLPAPINAGS